MSLYFTQKRKNMDKYRYDIRGVFFVVIMVAELSSCESSYVIRLNNISSYGAIAIPFLQGTNAPYRCQGHETKRESNRRCLRVPFAFFHATEMFPFQDLKYDITLTSMLFTYVSYAFEHVLSLLHNVFLTLLRCCDGN